jgi:hypothetical protein
MVPIKYIDDCARCGQSICDRFDDHFAKRGQKPRRRCPACRRYESAKRKMLTPSGKQAAEAWSRLAPYMDHLSHRERRVLELRWGLGGELGGEPRRTLDEVGRTFNVTRERIRQIEYRAVQVLVGIALEEALG